MESIQTGWISGAAETPTWSAGYEKRAITLLAGGFGLVGLDRWIVAPVFPAMMRDLGLSYQDLGNLVGALAIGWGGLGNCNGPCRRSNGA